MLGSRGLQSIHLLSRDGLYRNYKVISNNTIIINSGISHQNRAMKPRDTHVVRSTAPQRNKEFKEMDTKLSCN